MAAKKPNSLLDMAKTMRSGAAPTQAPAPGVTPDEGKAKAARPPEQGQAAAKRVKEMDKGELTAMHLRLPKELHKRLQIQRIEEERPMNDIIVDAVNTYLERTGPAKRRE